MTETILTPANIATRAAPVSAGRRRVPAGEARRLSARFTAPVEAFLVRNRARLAWLHAAMFVLFVTLLVGPLLLADPPEHATALSHLATFANYAIWGLWFPLVLLSVLFTGRSWCGLLCPMGAAAEWANRIGPQYAIPRWLRWEGTPIVSFIVVTILGQTLGVRDHAEAIALVFGGTLLAAIAIGFLYGRRKRAWCRHMCPIGLLLGVFSRLGAVQFAPKRPSPGGDAYATSGPCPTMIDIARKTESRHCIECFRCVSPAARGGLYLRLRRPGAEVEAIRAHNPRLVEVWFLFLGAGAALGGFLWLVLPLYERLRQSVGEWFIERGWSFIGEAGPWWLMSVHPERREIFNWLDFMMIVGFMAACMVALAAVLTLTTSAAAWLSGRLGGDRDFKARFVELGYQYAPVAMVSLLLGLGGALFEPLAAMAGGAAVGGLKGAILLAGFLWSAHIGRRILARQGVSRGGAALALMPGLIGSALVALAWWPAVVGL